MAVMRIKTCFAWLPKTTFSNQRIFFKKYIRMREYVYGRAGDGPMQLNEFIFLPAEYTMYLLRKSSN